MNNPASEKRHVGIELKRNGLYGVALESSGAIADRFKSVAESGGETALHLGSFISELKKRFGEFDRVGLAVPGLINRQTSRVAYSARNPEHAQFDFLSEIEKVAGVKIQLENDANAAAFGEFRLGGGRDSKDMFYATIGEGVGGAIIFDGELWQGDSGFAGEFGYMTVNSEGTRLEDVASTSSILNRTKARFHQDPTSSLNEIGEEQITASDIIREAKNEDDFAQLMLERTGFYVGTALAGVINLLNVEKIVIGGEIMEAGDLLLESIISRSRELSFAPGFESVKIVRGEFGEFAGAIGAAVLSSSKPES